MIDAVTSSIYGHVVGSNPIGEVYISPYASILEQIQHRFPGSEIKVNEPLDILARLIECYSISVEDEKDLAYLKQLRKAYEQFAFELNEGKPISSLVVQPYPYGAAIGAFDDQGSSSTIHSPLRNSVSPTLKSKQNVVQSSGSLTSAFPRMTQRYSSPTPDIFPTEGRPPKTANLLPPTIWGQLQLPRPITSSSSVYSCMSSDAESRVSGGLNTSEECLTTNAPDSKYETIYSTPPSNTLRVANIPVDVSDKELKALFSERLGYKRLWYSTKKTGPMCFVEFEDVSLAAKTLHELNKFPLRNSVNGGIQLGFSKDSFGVRLGETTIENTSGATVGMKSTLSSDPNDFGMVRQPVHSDISTELGNDREI